MIRFRLFGDTSKARNFLGFARKQMEVLRARMRINELWNDVRNYYNPENGLKIKCSVISGHENVDIYFPPTPVVVELEEVIEEVTKTTYKLLITVGHYGCRHGISSTYYFGYLESIVSSVWSIEDEKIVEEPVEGIPDLYREQWDNLSYEGIPEYVEFKGLIFGRVLAYHNAEREEYSDLECHLVVPFLSSGSGFSNHNITGECSESAVNALGGLDTAEQYWKDINVHAYAGTTVICGGREYTGWRAQNSKIKRREYNIGVTGYGGPDPVVFSYGGWMATPTLTTVGTSLLLGEDKDSRITASAYMTSERRDNSNTDYIPCCPGITAYGSDVFTRVINSTKSFTVRTPLGLLFENVEITTCDINLTWTQSNECGEASADTYTVSGGYKDIGMTNQDAMKIKLGEGTAELYFSQYDVWNGWDLTEDSSMSVCPDDSYLKNHQWTFLTDPTEWGERHYNVLAGIDGVKHEGLTAAVKNLVDYYYTKYKINGEVVPSNCLDNMLSINFIVVSTTEVIE